MAQRTEQTDHRPIRRLLRRLIKAPAAWSLIWPMLLLVGSYAAYTRWYSDYFAEKYSSLDPQLVTVTEPHEYVRMNLVEEVYRETRLSDLSPLDRQATAKLAEAFSSHPWVKHVHSVRKLPGGAIDIELDYRLPVAVFHLTGESSWLREIEAYLTNLGYSIHGGADKLFFPLDGEGVMLPTDQMTLADTQELIHIEVSEVFPTGNEGTPFGDRRVESAALLAKLLAAIKDQIRVATITVKGDPRINMVPQLELITGNNTQLIWGSPPGMEQPGERGAREKLTDLISGNFANFADLRVAAQSRRPVQ
ncbi:hypothetical protein NHH03_27495 [Stieleria sp. TO1_6]|uniref:hypothetical protein n=1 Tax=Stieleria tagensis TaxID=2956795 RepID=UPI00209AE0BB|nr:hypothetical protein [Stieleria tagensis]MCO8125514.1 hypothetical protein [Stieleria tagensis]